MHQNLMLNIRELKQKGDIYKNTIYSNRIKLLIIGIFLAGLWLGTMLVIKNGYINNFIKNGINYLINSDYIKTLKVIAVLNSGAILVVFISGFSACGLVTSIGLPCVYGIICGAANSYIYSNYKLNGVFFTLIIIIPFAVVTTLLITALSDSAVNLTKKVMKSLAFGEAGKRGEVKLYFYTGGIVIIVECVSALLQSFLITKIGLLILNL